MLRIGRTEKGLLAVSVCAIVFGYVFYSKQDFSKWLQPGNTMMRETHDPVDTEQVTPNRNVKLHVPDRKEKLDNPDLLNLDPEKLFNRTVIITGFSQNHFIEAKGMLASVQKFLPHTKIIVYDLGLDKESLEQIRRMCNVDQVRHFDTTKYPAHVKNLHTYAFKPIIVMEALSEFEVVFWCDASARFQADPRKMYTYLKEQQGFLRRTVTYDPHIILTRTHPAMFKALDVDRGAYSRDKGNCPAFEANRLLFVNTTLLRQKFIVPWLTCALRSQCIAPNDSILSLNRHGPKYTHRFDQAALSILAYKNMYGVWNQRNDRTELFVSVVDLSRSHKGADTVQFCTTV